VLQLVNDLLVFRFGRVHHFDGFMPAGIECLALGRNGAHAKLS
jgi:hypothetical protein